MNGIQFIDGEFFSYSDIEQRSNDWSGIFQSGSTVAIMLPTCPEFVFSFLGAMNAGAIPCAVYPPLRLGQLQEWKDKLKKDLDTIRPQFVITEKRLVALLQKTINYPVMAVEEIKTKLVSQSASPRPTPSDEQIAFIQLSSGSTGNSKAVAIDHFALKTNIELICNAFNSYIDKKEIRALSWLPLYHDMGLVGLLLGSIANGNMLYIMGPEKFLVDPLLWMDLIGQYQINVTVAPNFAFGLVLKRAMASPDRQFNLNTLKIALCAAEPIAPQTLLQFENYFQHHGLQPKVISPAYGLAEATLAVSFSAFGTGVKTSCFNRQQLELNGIAITDDQGQSICSLGKPLPQIKIEVRSSSGEVLNEKRLGEIFISAPSSMSGLWPTLGLKRNGWFATGDQGFMFEGELYLWGRLKDIVITNGRNIDPSIIEHALSSLPGIRPGKVVFTSNQNDLGDEELYLFAEGDEAAGPELVEQINDTILTQFGLNVPHIIILKKGGIPTTSSGKLRRRETVRRWLQNNLEASWFDKLKLKGELLWLKMNQ